MVRGVHTQHAQVEGLGGVRPPDQPCCRAALLGWCGWRAAQLVASLSMVLSSSQGMLHSPGKQR